MQSTEHFTLKQVADSIKKTIEQRYNRTYWVLAEMHKLNETRKGHCYPELVQKEDGSIVAEMRGTIWKNSFDKIRNRFMEVVKEPLRDGLELLFLVKIVYHPVYNLGLEIIDIDPNYTLGALQRERQETLERLNKEGILNANQQLEMALIPKRLAIISQADSKGYSDFIMLLNGHPKHYRFNTFLFEAALQGDAAVNSITAQLNRISRIRHHFDAVLIIRGGGGEIGMHCYNNYDLAKAIATFPLPVLTGIGHSTNMTVCEMIAYNNGITPSDLAYYMLRIFEELDEPLDEAMAALPGIVKNLLLEVKNEFAGSVKSFQVSTRQNIREHQVAAQVAVNDFNRVVRMSLQNERNTVKQQSDQLNPSLQRYFNGLRLKTETIQSNIALHGRNKIRSEEQSLSVFIQRIKLQVPNTLKQSEQRLEQFTKQLQLVDPVHVLKRGFSIVTNENGVINAENPAKTGSILKIRNAETIITASAIDIETKNSD